MKKIVRIGAVSLGKILGIMYAFFGLIFGLLFSFFAVLGGVLSHDQGGGPSMFFGVGAVILIPLIYGGLGYVFGVLSGWVFNLAARLAGGLELEIEEAAPERKIGS